MREPGQPCVQCGNELPVRGPLACLCPECLMGHGLSADPDGEAVQNRLPSTEELQSLIPQLEILHVLGHGGMGGVYKARQRDLDRHVAVKVLRPELQNDPTLTDRFVREARNLAQLDHPNIVRIHDFGRAEELYFLVMEFVEGSTLRDLINGRLLAPEDAFSILPDVCDALQYAHERGVVHRDVKPANILVETTGRVKVADFGLSKVLRGKGFNPTLTHSLQAMGTPSYMAPEQMRRTRDVDHRADIFSLGVMLYEILTGELPMGRFEAPSARVKVDPRVDDVVLRALDRDADRRFQNARDLGSALQALRHEPGDRSRPTPQPEANSPLPSIPFSISGELHEATGILTLEGDALHIEYRKRLVGLIPTEVRNLTIPISEIKSIEYRTGFFAPRLRLIPRTMTPFEGLPCGDYDVRFAVKNRDGEKARLLAEIVSRRLPR